ncbi:MAG: protein-glutamate O-methyltransferase CheR, partial [Planctomycetota bacterium]
MELKKLTLPEFKRMAALIYERTGIHLPETKLTLLSNRLRKRLKALNLSSYSDYYKLLCDPKSCEDELPHFLSAVTTNETYFFRNERLWKYIRETWIPELVKRKDGKAKTVRVWSAACSTGEEAYTMAICLHEDLCTKGPWRVTIIGSDISPRVLEHAKNARYNDYAVGEVSPAMRRKWF